MGDFQAECSSVRELIESCTCPICQDLYEQPVNIRCSHTFCRNCLDSMVKKFKHQHPFQMPGFFGLMPVPIQNESPLQCPVCRALFLAKDEFVANEAIAQKREQLRSIKKERCEADDCWNEVAEAPWTVKRLCLEHHQEHLDNMQNASSELLGDISNAVNNEETKALMLQLSEKRDELFKMKRHLLQRLEAQFAAYECQLESLKEKLERRDEERSERAEKLRDDLESLDAAVQSNDLLSQEKLLEPAKARLMQFKRDCPTRKLVSAFESEQLQREFDSLLAKMQCNAHPGTYDDLPREQKTKKVLQTKDKQPWDLEILTNVSGLVMVERELKFQRDHPNGETVDGPLLIVNFKSFPSGRLHVTNMDGRDIGTIKLEFKDVGMPGRFCVCNERQLILATDAGRNIALVSSIDGKLLKTFGQESNESLSEPLGMCCRGGVLYLSDTGNKRIQLYDLDNNYSLIDTIRHESFARVCDVTVTSSVIAVLDQQANRLHVFDKKTRQFMREQKLGGQGFGVTADKFGNLLVTVPSADRIVLFDPDGMTRVKEFAIVEPDDEEEEQDEVSELSMLTMRMMNPGVKLYHGLAMETDRRRLFVADTGRQRILVLDL